MGLVHATITLINPKRPELKPLDVKMLVDTGANLMCITEHVRLQLGLDEGKLRDVTLADGSERSVPYVGPIEVRFDNRVAFVGAMVMGDEPLFGAIPMEDMDLVVLPGPRKLVVNPDSPNFARAYAK